MYKKKVYCILYNNVHKIKETSRYHEFLRSKDKIKKKKSGRWSRWARRGAGSLSKTRRPHVEE